MDGWLPPNFAPSSGRNPSGFLIVASLVVFCSRSFNLSKELQKVGQCDLREVMRSMAVSAEPKG
jgi:hypothetical protein